jgi:hypothetical protein
MSTTNAPERSTRPDGAKVYQRVYRKVYCT